MVRQQWKVKHRFAASFVRLGHIFENIAFDFPNVTISIDHFPLCHGASPYLLVSPISSPCLLTPCLLVCLLLSVSNERTKLFTERSDGAVVNEIGYVVERAGLPVDDCEHSAVALCHDRE
jgi:hypothetical protein